MINQELRATGPLSTGAPLTVDRDAFVGGNVSSTSTIGIGGALHVPPPSTVGAGVTYGGLAREAVNVPVPCDCMQRVQIKPIVAAHRPPTNDDGTVGLSPMALANLSTPLRVDLPCGQYYLSRIATTFPLAIVAHGRTALYVDGDVVASAFLALTAASGAELDVFIAGAFMPSGSLVIGSANYPALTRVYVGAKPVLVPATASIAGSIYSTGPLTWGPAEMYGALFAGDFVASQTAAAIHYDRALANAADACPARAGSPCATCADCSNQACVNGSCGACASTADCCAPLICSAGQCLPSVR